MNYVISKCIFGLHNLEMYWITKMGYKVGNPKFQIIFWILQFRNIFRL